MASMLFGFAFQPIGRTPQIKANIITKRPSYIDYIIYPQTASDSIESQMYQIGLNPTGKAKNCLASWYGAYFHGRTTANMEIFDKEKISAAHKKLPFNTYLLVTNYDTGKQLIVRVNDRGPYITGREVDLSEAAARELGGHEQGVMKIKYEILAKEARIDLYKLI